MSWKPLERSIFILACRSFCSYSSYHNTFLFRKKQPSHFQSCRMTDNWLNPHQSQDIHQVGYQTGVHMWDGYGWLCCSFMESANLFPWAKSYHPLKSVPLNGWTITLMSWLPSHLSLAQFFFSNVTNIWPRLQPILLESNPKNYVKYCWMNEVAMS